MCKVVQICDSKKFKNQGSYLTRKSVLNPMTNYPGGPISLSSNEGSTLSKGKPYMDRSITKIVNT